MKKLFALTLGCTLAVTVVHAEWLDTFDTDTAGAGNPDNYSVFGGTVLDSGVTSGTSVSGANSAFIVSAMTNTGFGFAAILVHDAVAPMDFTTGVNPFMSAQLSSTVDLPGGHVAFKAWDADGSQFRTADADLFPIGTAFSGIAQPFSGLTQNDDASMGTGGLDLASITQYGIVFFEDGTAPGDVTLNIDNFRGAVPEPSVAALFVVGGVLIIGQNRRKKMAAMQAIGS